ncbi:MAG: hypothetical protein LUH04_11100 [Clostridium sp.]|nr:hypothetical protein [Clostridium sp.]
METNQNQPTITPEEKKEIDFFNSINPIFGSESLIRFTNLPLEMRTEAVSYAAVKSYAGVVEHVPYEKLSERIIVEALKKDSAEYPYLKHHPLLNDDILNAVMDFNPDLIRFVPDHLKTKERCQEVVIKRPYLLKDIPEEFRTRELCEIALENVDPFVESDGFSEIKALRGVPYSDLALKYFEIFTQDKNVNPRYVFLKSIPM